MFRMLGAVVLVVALIGCAWWLTSTPTKGMADVAAPRPAVTLEDPSAPAGSEPLRSVAGPEPGRSGAQAAEEPATELAPTAGPVTTPVQDLSALDLDALEVLRARLAKELSTSTTEELQRRHEAGMAELMGAGEAFDVGSAWDPNAVMNLRVVDGATWRVVLPREEFPEAYALLDRRLAVEAELESRGK